MAGVESMAFECVGQFGTNANFELLGLLRRLGVPKRTAEFELIGLALDLKAIPHDEDHEGCSRASRAPAALVGRGTMLVTFSTRCVCHLDSGQRSFSSKGCVGGNESFHAARQKAISGVGLQEAWGSWR